MTTLKTKVHAFRFDLSDDDDAKAWRKLKAERKAQGAREFETHGGNSTHYALGQLLADRVIELDTSHVFGDQWNTAPIDGLSGTGYRVHEFAIDYLDNRSIKKGYWLEITPEMRAIQENTLVCGYCGHQTRDDSKRGQFCDKCLDSEYLKETELYLLRLLPAAVTFRANRPPLTMAEEAVLQHLYVERQTTGANSRNAAKLAKQRERIEADYMKETTAAVTKRDGLTWLMDRDISIDNVIYYEHTDTFCFGWRSPLSRSVEAKLQEQLCADGDAFPFDWKVKSEPHTD